MTQANTVFADVTGYVIVAGLVVAGMTLLGVFVWRVIVRTRRKPRT